MGNTTLTGLSGALVKDFVVDRKDNLEELNISFNILLEDVMARGRFNMIGR